MDALEDLTSLSWSLLLLNSRIAGVSVTSVSSVFERIFVLPSTQSIINPPLFLLPLLFYGITEP